MIEKKLFTDRLVLRRSEAALSELVTEYFIRNAAFLETWDPVHDSAFYTEAYQRKALEKDLEIFLQGQGLRYWLMTENETEIIGTFSFNNIVMGPFCSCFLGYRLDEKRQGQGLMTEALGKGIELAFGPLGLHRIEANIIPRNKASLRVAEKLHFRNEGLSPRYLKINGRWEDHIHMILLNEEMEKR
ncbi:GNAT family N-acetyltransferase [Eubacterium sp. 1001713B170207_170306_E7]|uniref:GNAT family N-acetyltransferase n=1 Tax=Eubacterium sp. 1001713B170207_170306_E7 TaxID=2787097 RepID=UPI0018988001|nr:GNAT family N-acetyltransferase [Eubacterium sp. 1001713B170207_170306_E7]